MKLTDRETATVLFALSEYQESAREHERKFILPYNEHFAEHTPLSPCEVEELCERINTDTDEGPAVQDEANLANLAGQRRGALFALDAVIDYHEHTLHELRDYVEHGKPKNHVWAHLQRVRRYLERYPCMSSG